jgi:hypothetical protein
MASGDAVVQVLKVLPPGASAATLDARAGGSTPAENVRVWDFDASSDQYMDFLCKLEGYDGGGLTFTIVYSMTSATSNSVVWGIAIRRLDDDAEDIDSSHSYTFNNVTDTVPTASGEVSYPTIAFTDGADMDSWAEGELAIVRIMRDADNGSDDAAGFAELWAPPLGLET